MLIRTEDNANLINFDNITRMYVDANSQSLICTIPSAHTRSGYENLILINQNYLRTHYHIKEIAYMYSQYVVSNNGVMFIPPKVYNINTNESNKISASSVVVTPQANSAKIDANNRVTMGFSLTAGGRGLLLDVDYTITNPFFKGENSYHRFVFHLLSSNTYLYKDYLFRDYKYKESKERTLSIDIPIGASTNI